MTVGISSSLTLHSILQETEMRPPIFGIEPDRPSSPFLQFSRSNANHNQPTEVTGTPV
jgi:hypothetical protein